jgi:RecA/RadA recombinase
LLDFHQPDPRKIGVMFGNPKPLLAALKFYASMRGIRRIAIKEGDEVGSRTRAKIKQSGCAVPRSRI